MNSIVTLFSEDELKQIENRIASTEKKTSGEIVVQVVHSSHSYWWIHFAWALAGWLVVSMILLLESTYRSPWAHSVWEILGWQVIAILLGSAISRFEWIKRLTASKKFMSERVHRQALANFMDHGLHETKDRTGVLVYLSLLERQVEILADKGIDEKTGNDFWKKQVNHIVQGIRSKKATEHLCEAIDQIGDALAKDFPIKEGDENELSNHVRTGHSHHHNKE